MQADRTGSLATELEVDPAQTAGGREPFLFSQCQPIHARTLAPVPDNARVRLTYEAAITVPRRSRP